MGSPYRKCDIELVGADHLHLPKSGWQDIYAWSVDLRNLALIRWDIANNEPGHRLYVIDFETNAIEEFLRDSGFPRIISFPNDDRVVIKKCYNNSDKSEREDYTVEYSFSTVFMDPVSGIRGRDEDGHIL